MSLIIKKSYRLQSKSTPAEAMLHNRSFVETITIPFLVLLMTVLFSCKKNDTEKTPVDHTQMVTAKGQTIGTAVTKMIGPAGGAVSSADGNVSIIIPSGALTKDESISIQEVTNQLPGAHGKIYRLLPHNIVFQKPASITVKYNDDSIRNTVPEMLGLVYQDEHGKWFHANEPVLNKQNHTLTVMTTHFSDWGYFPYLFIEPSVETVDPNAQLDLRVMATTPEDYQDVALMDSLPLNEPILAPASYCGAWSYSGEGSLSGNENTAHYHAPNSVPKGNPESASVSIKMHRKGQFLLVANIYIRSDLHIHYMQVDETDINAGGTNYPSRLYLYGSFGSDPGVGKRTVKLNNTPVTVAFWTPALIACDIPSSGPYSSGMVEVQTGNKTTSKMLNEWTVTLQYGEKQSPDGALTKKTNLILHLRGDAEGSISNGQTNMVQETSLNQMSKGVINVTGGSFTTQVSGDGCGTYNVNWDPLKDLELARKKSSEQGDGLYGTVVNNPNGFDVKLYFIATDALMTHRKYTACAGGGSLNNVAETIDLQGYKEVVIPLRFSESKSNATILAGTMPEKPCPAASGLFWDVQSLPANVFKASLKWDAVRPKFN